MCVCVGSLIGWVAAVAVETPAPAPGKRKPESRIRLLPFARILNSNILGVQTLAKHLLSSLLRYD